MEGIAEIENEKEAFPQQTQAEATIADTISPIIVGIIIACFAIYLFFQFDTTSREIVQDVTTSSNCTLPETKDSATSYRIDLTLTGISIYTAEIQMTYRLFRSDSSKTLPVTIDSQCSYSLYQNNISVDSRVIKIPLRPLKFKQGDLVSESTDPILVELGPKSDRVEANLYLTADLSQVDKVEVTMHYKNFGVMENKFPINIIITLSIIYIFINFVTGFNGGSKVLTIIIAVVAALASIPYQYILTMDPWIQSIAKLLQVLLPQLLQMLFFCELAYLRLDGRKPSAAESVLYVVLFTVFGYLAPGEEIGVLFGNKCTFKTMRLILIIELAIGIIAVGITAFMISDTFTKRFWIVAILLLFTQGARVLTALGTQNVLTHVSDVYIEFWSPLIIDITIITLFFLQVALPGGYFDISNVKGDSEKLLVEELSGKGKNDIDDSEVDNLQQDGEEP